MNIPDAQDLMLFGNRFYFDQYPTISDASTVYQKNFLKNLKHAEQVGKYRNYFDFHPTCSKKKHPFMLGQRLKAGYLIFQLEF
jgi:hypothetical protein